MMQYIIYYSLTQHILAPSKISENVIFRPWPHVSAGSSWKRTYFSFVFHFPKNTHPRSIFESFSSVHTKTLNIPHGVCVMLGQGLLFVPQLLKLKQETSLILYSHKHFQNLIECFRSWIVNPSMYINDDRLLLDLRKTIEIFCVSYVSQWAVWDEVFWRGTFLSPLALCFNADKLCYLQDGKVGLNRT